MAFLPKFIGMREALAHRRVELGLGKRVEQRRFVVDQDHELHANSGQRMLLQNRSSAGARARSTATSSLGMRVLESDHQRSFRRGALLLAVSFCTSWSPVLAQRATNRPAFDV